jgi:uroporphyrinogen decarboxylase
MNSRQRVLAAVNHEEPDRVPLDFWWSHEMKVRLFHHLGLKDEEELQTYLGSDIRGVYPTYVGPALRRYEDGSYEDFWGVIRKPFAHGSGGQYDEVVSPPLCDARSLDDVEKIRWPSPDWFDYDSLIEQCERHKQHAIVLGRMGRECQTLFIQLWYLRGLENILLDMITWPDLVEALIAKIMLFRLEHLKRILAVAQGRADILQLADDYGTQDGPIMSPSMWRRFFAPHLKTMADLAHEAGLKVFLHCDGGIRPIIADLIELGVDILNPIQPSAAGMEPQGLKRDFGDRLCFHGAVDTQGTLPLGTREEVVAEVEERIDTLGPGGGYILAPVHTVEPDVPIENLLAVYDTAKSFGVYAH